MSETVNIGQIAEIISERIFNRFGWTVTGPTNENFGCLKEEEHQKKSVHKHPCDVVFKYEDPYEKQTIHLLTDLKSYAKGSIQKNDVAAALRELAKTLDCASVSAEWRTRHVNSSENWKVHGLLFIYNHDNEYDKDLESLLREINTDSFFTPRGRRLYVMSPARIRYLLNIISDLAHQQQAEAIPHFKKFPLLYPHKVLRKSNHTTATVGQIETLLGPWQMVPYVIGEKDKAKEGVYLYYNGTGSSPDEFSFILDYCFKSQVVRDNVEIQIRMPNGGPDALSNFEKGRENFAQSTYAGISEGRLKQFSAVVTETSVWSLKSIVVGMKRRLE